MQRNSSCLNTLKLVKKIVGVKPLPRKLLLQMDNYVKDNMNHPLLAFLSLLIAHKVFEEVELGFLVVGHFFFFFLALNCHRCCSGNYI
jgi:hypothetical protein